MVVGVYNQRVVAVVAVVVVVVVVVVGTLFPCVVAGISSGHFLDKLKEEILIEIKGRPTTARSTTLL